MADRRATSIDDSGRGYQEIGSPDRLLTENLSVVDSLIIPSGAALPGAPNTGDIFWHTVEHTIYQWDGAAWHPTTVGNIAETITVGKANADFTSVKDAVDFIVDASAAKPYVVQVFPGVYDEDPFTMKSYVSVVGEAESGLSSSAVVLRTTDLNAHFITGAPFSHLSNVGLLGPTGIGFASVHHDTPVAAPFTLSRVTVQRGDIGFLVDPALAISVVNMDLCGFEYVGSSLGTFLQVSGFGIVSVSTCVLYSPIPATLSNGIVADGANVVVTVNDSRFGATGMTYALSATNGCDVTISTCEFTSGSTAIHVGAAGATVLRIQNALVRPGFTTDLEILSATADVLFTGTLDKNKVSVVAGATFAAAFTDLTPSEEGMVVFGELWLGTQSQSVPQATLTRTTANTGRVSGGLLNRAGGLDLSVSAGTGFVNTGTGIVFVQWPGDTISLPANEDDLEVYVDFNGTVLSAPEGTVNHEDAIVLGEVVTAAASIVFISEHYVDITQHIPHNHVYSQEVIGPISVAGTAASKAGSPSLQLNVDSGAYYIYDNKRTASATAAITFVYWYHDGLGGWTYVVGQTAIDPDFYDDGSGTLAALAPGEFKKDLLYLTTHAGGTEYHIVYGQEVFLTQVAAEQGNNPASAAILNDDALRIAGIVVEQGATDIASIVDQRPRIGQLATGSTAITDHGLLSGLADDDHPQYQLRSEKAAVGGYASLDGLGQVPTAQIPFTFTAPADVDTNPASAGIVDEVARSDHKHDIATAVPVAIGSANAEGTSISLARADHVHAITAGAVAPGSPAAGHLWFNTAAGSNFLMAYDASRTKWLSTSEYVLAWGRDNADGNTLLSYGISTAGTGTGVLIPYNATIKRIAARSTGGEPAKIFYILVNGVSVRSFALAASVFSENTTDIDLAAGSSIWVEADAAGIGSLETIVALWIAWRS